MAKFSKAFMGAANVASSAALNRKRQAIELGISALPPKSRMAAATSRFEATMPKSLVGEKSKTIPKARTSKAIQIDSPNDFVPVVKGSPIPPGESGFSNVVPTGNRQAFNSAFEDGASYWWNLGGDNPKDIHQIAEAAIRYTSPGGLKPGSATKSMAEGYGMSLPELHQATENIVYRKDPSKISGKIVFARAPKSSSAYYEGGGEGLREGVQVGESVIPTATMDIPKNLGYKDPSIFEIINSEKLAEQIGSATSQFNTDSLKGAEFHDFMKEFSENVRAVAPKGANLPPGTQGYLDLPYTKDANEAANRYLVEKGYDADFSDPIVESFISSTDLNPDGAERFPVSVFNKKLKERVSNSSIKKEDLFRLLSSDKPPQSQIDAAVDAALGAS